MARNDKPSIAEVSDLLRRLHTVRELDEDDPQRQAWISEKDALIARIEPDADTR